MSDLLEWGPETTPEGQFADVLKNEISLDELIAQAPAAPALQDDRPVNEYYVMRRRAGPGRSGDRVGGASSAAPEVASMLATTLPVSQRQSRSPRRRPRPPAPHPIRDL